MLGFGGSSLAVAEALIRMRNLRLLPMLPVVLSLAVRAGAQASPTPPPNAPEAAGQGVHPGQSQPPTAGHLPPTAAVITHQYPSILYKSEIARKRGLDKDPHYLEMLKFLETELLTRELDRASEAEADKIQPGEIKDYYHKNAENFEQASLQRILLPKPNQNEPKGMAQPAGTPATTDDRTLARVADLLRARAAANEDFDKLQRAAYEAAGVQAPPPPTLNAKVRPENLPASQASVFDLEPGQLSPVFNEPRGFYFYRLVTKSTGPLADVNEEIRNNLRNQHLETLRQELQSAISYDLDKDYFGSDAPPAGPGTKPAQNLAPSNPRGPAKPAPATQPKE
jgi:PPIC-type PPIASE domain